MPYTRVAEEMLKSMGAKHLQDTLSNILNDDFYEKDFTMTVNMIEFLYMLELYDLAVVTEKEGRLILTPYGEKTLHKLNSLLY
jgi:hypothetical protein